jgi:NAD+ synthetase
MRVAIAQINPIVGDIEGNRRKILGGIERAEKVGADLAVFPELAVTGYPPQDLLDRPSFVEANLASLGEIARRTGETPAVVGFVDRDRSGRTPGLLNAAALLHRGAILSVHAKSLLPTYDVFDEVRYFSPAAKVELARLPQEKEKSTGGQATRGTKKNTGAGEGMRCIGITVCEDAWNDATFWSTRRYATDPVAELVKRGAELLVNISASPYEFGKRDLRMRMLSELARKHGRFLVFVNQAGGNDELVFDGNSGVFAPDGRMIARAAEFTEDFVLVELDERGKTVEVPSEDIGSLHGALVTGLGDYVRKSGFAKAVVGLSGGIDSAVTACIAAEALGAENVRGISMPSPYSSQHSIDDAREVAGKLGIRFDMARIDGVFGKFGEALGGLFAGTEPGTAEENIQARIRGVILMAISNKFGELVLATGNKSEMSVGYCTLYGDMCGSLAVIGDVPKTKIYDLARYINRKRRVIPENTFTKPPSAELKPNQTDQDTLPAYDVLDGILRAHVEEAKDAGEIVKLGFDEATVAKVLRMIRQSEFKRKQAAPVIKVTTKAFGVGRRMPIVNGWK